MSAAAFFAGHAETTIVVNHLGCMTGEDLADADARGVWSGLEALAALPQVHMKLSMLCYTNPEWAGSVAGSVAGAVVDAVHRVIAIFGIDRCFFASNFPVDVKDGWPAERLLPAFIELAGKYGEDGARKLFGENARTVYRLPVAKV
jgi:predicted TIM-barrel fold metal-dependent hydrolase